MVCFFKQKTAYEMRISDWSSDVCSSDLGIKHIDLLAEPFDIVIRIGHQPDSAVVSRQMGNVKLGLYAAPSYLVRKGEPAAPAELARHECLRTSASKDGAVWELWAGSKVEKVTVRSEEHTSELQSLMRISYAVFCLK